MDLNRHTPHSALLLTWYEAVIRQYVWVIY